MHVACELVRPDQAVLSHIQLTKLLEESQDDSLSELSEVICWELVSLPFDVDWRVPLHDTFGCV